MVDIDREFAIRVVIVKKSHPDVITKEDAIEVSRMYSDNYTYCNESKNAFWVYQMPKQMFSTGRFMSKINDHVTVIKARVRYNI